MVPEVSMSSLTESVIKQECYLDWMRRGTHWTLSYRDNRDYFVQSWDFKTGRNVTRDRFDNFDAAKMLLIKKLAPGTKVL